MRSLLIHEIKSRWGAVLGWGVGLSVFGAIYLHIFPEVEEQLAALADLSVYQAFGFDMGTFEGFIGSTIVLFMPIWLGIYVIIISTKTLAGEEEDGTLELLLATPLHRWQIVSAKMMAIGLAVLVILAIVGTVNGLVLDQIKTVNAVEITFWQLFIAVLNAWPLIMVFTALGLFLSAFLPNRKTAVISLSVIFIASYLGENLAKDVASLAFIKPYSLFTYFDSSSTVFTEGVKAIDVMILLGAAALFFGLAVLSFQRRNVTVGTWPWSRRPGVKELS